MEELGIKMTWEAVPGKRGFRVAEGLPILQKGADVALGSLSRGNVSKAE